MDARYVLAIDQGTTSTRALLFDRAGRVATGHHRQRHLDARHAATGEHVVVVQRAGLDPDPHLARAGLGPSGPLSRSQWYAATQSSSPAGKPCSGARR